MKSKLRVFLKPRDNNSQHTDVTTLELNSKLQRKAKLQSSWNRTNIPSYRNERYSVILISTSILVPVIHKEFLVLRELCSFPSFCLTLRQRLAKKPEIQKLLRVPPPILYTFHYLNQGGPRVCCFPKEDE